MGYGAIMSIDFSNINPCGWIVNKISERGKNDIEKLKRLRNLYIEGQRNDNI